MGQVQVVGRKCQWVESKLSQCRIAFWSIQMCLREQLHICFSLLLIIYLFLEWAIHLYGWKMKKYYKMYCKRSPFHFCPSLSHTQYPSCISQVYMLETETILGTWTTKGFNTSNWALRKLLENLEEWDSRGQALEFKFEGLTPGVWTGGWEVTTATATPTPPLLLDTQEVSG